MINLSVGQQLGNYRIIQRLGQGGFANVYLGKHLHLKTQAAIKVMHTQMSQSDLQDFVKEAQMIAALKHPHIVSILDFGEEKNIPFLVMEYAAQGTLRQRHPKGSVLPATTILPYVKQIASALQYAHDQKLIHRDIKPENMLVGTNNDLLLSDFGIAVIAHSTSSLKTQRPSGTPLYMAPEQWDGKSRPASDQYALGVIVYEWLSGKCPFQGNIHALPHQHRSVAPPPFDKSLQISSRIEDVVQKALSKDPEQRFPSVAAFAVALEYASQPTPSPLPQQPSPSLQLPEAGIQSTTVQRPLQMKNMQILYQEGVKAREQGNLAQAVLLWQEILNHDPSFQHGTLLPQMAKLLRQRALQAGHLGEWQEATATWKRLLQLEPHDTQAREYLPIAEQNQKYTWIYQNARQFVNDGDLSAARKLLEEVWQNAPYYGDPAGLAKKVKISTPPRFEEAGKRGKRYQAIKDFSEQVDMPVPLIYISFFCVASGVGTTIGILTQSWIWALASAIVVFLLSAILGYRKAMNWPLMITLVLIGVAITFGFTWYASSLPYGQPQLGHFWFLGNRTLWIGRQVNAGVIIGIICPVLFLGYFKSFIYPFVVLSCMIILLLLIPLFGGGFGFGLGWLFLLMGLVVGLVDGASVPASIYICWPRKQSQKENDMVEQEQNVSEYSKSPYSYYPPELRARR